MPMCCKIYLKNQMERNHIKTTKGTVTKERCPYCNQLMILTTVDDEGNRTIKYIAKEHESLFKD